MKQFRFLDITGVGNSGKSAVVDLLREFDGVYGPEYWFEFDFLRVPNGLLDLRHRLVEDWSPVRSHYGVRAFIDVAEKMGRDPAWWDLPGQMAATSQRYDRRFGGRFRTLAREFAQSFIRTSFAAEWPYDGVNDSGIARLSRKILARIGLRSALVREVLVADGEGFDVKARAFMTQLYDALVPDDTELIVLNNGFEAYSPKAALDMLGPQARQIVVLRDPRDIFVSGLNKHRVRAEDRQLIAFDNDGLNKSFLGTDDIKRFVERFRVYYEQLYTARDDRVLHLHFEDLVLDYENSLKRIVTFLGLDPARHVRPGRYFQPEKSAKNIGLWKRYSRPEEVEYIAVMLPGMLRAAPQPEQV